MWFQEDGAEAIMVGITMAARRDLYMRLVTSDFGEPSLSPNLIAPHLLVIRRQPSISRKRESEKSPRTFKEKCSEWLRNGPQSVCTSAFQIQQDSDNLRDVLCN
jgi:hypothetical protein